VTAALDIVAEVGKDGRLSDASARIIRANLRQRTRHLDGAGTLDVRVTIGAPLRSSKANRLYWAVLGRIALAYMDSGRTIHTDALHLWYKGLYLPAIAAETEAETGEVLEVARVLTMPDGATRRTLTTRALTRAAFGVYLDRIASGDDVLALGVDLSDMMGEARTLRGGSVDESSDLASAPYVDAGAIWTMADL